MYVLVCVGVYTYMVYTYIHACVGMLVCRCEMCASDMHGPLGICHLLAACDVYSECLCSMCGIFSIVYIPSSITLLSLMGTFD